MKSDTYISTNLSNPSLFSIRPAGGSRVVFNLDTLYKQLQKVNAKSAALSQQYQGNVKFPSNIGLSHKNILLQGLDETLYRLANRADLSRLNPTALYNSIRNLQHLANSNDAFNAAYYGYIGQYYGVEPKTDKKGQMSKKAQLDYIKKIRAGLRDRAFKFVPDDNQDRINESDPARLLDWIADNLSDELTPYQQNRIRDGGATMVQALRALQAYELGGDAKDVGAMLGINFHFVK